MEVITTLEKTQDERETPNGTQWNTGIFAALAAALEHERSCFDDLSRADVDRSLTRRRYEDAVNTVTWLRRKIDSYGDIRGL